VGAEVRSSGNATNEPEKDVQSIKDEANDGVEGEVRLHSRWDEVEQRKHSKDRDEHVIVDNAWIPAVSSRDHVADKRHDEERPEELRNVSIVVLDISQWRETDLERSHSKIDDLHGCGSNGGIWDVWM